MRRIPPTLMLGLGLAVAAAGLLAGPVRGLQQPDSSFHLPWPVLAALFGASVVLRIHLQFRREVHSVTLMEMPLVLGLHFVDPAGMVLARLAGSVPALVVHSRQRGTKLLFNLALFALETCVAGLAFAWLLAGRAPVGTAGLTATFGAVLVTDLLSAALVITAISPQEGPPDGPSTGQALVSGAIAAVTNTSLALIAVAVLAADRQVAWLLLVLAAVLFIAYRAYASLREQHARLERLHHFTRVVARSERSGPVAATVLAETQELLRAQRAELTLFPAGRAPLRTVLDGQGQPATGPAVDAGPAMAILRRAVESEQAVLLRPPITDQALREALRDRGITDAMIAPLRAGAGVAGTLLVANRLGDVGAFTGQDLTLLQTLAGQAGGALARGQLVDDLHRAAAEREYQALHDPLTGLPNRTLFTDRVRLRAGRADSHTVARLGGDEFAVLVPALPDWDAAIAVGRQVRATLGRPLPIERWSSRSPAASGSPWVPTTAATPTCSCNAPTSPCTRPNTPIPASRSTPPSATSTVRDGWPWSERCARRSNRAA
jgi:GAF domain-containing protein